MKLLKCLCTFFLIFGLVGCGKEKPNNENNNQNNNNQNTTVDCSSHSLFNVLMGEWTLEDDYDPENHVFQNIIINEDGTVIVDGESYTWVANDYGTRNDRLAIIVMNGAEEICGVNVRQVIDEIHFYAEFPANNTQIGVYVKQ